MEILASLDVLVLSLSCMLLGTWRKEVLISTGEKAQHLFPSFFPSMAEGAAPAQGLGSTDSWAPCGLGEPLDPGGPVASIRSLLLAVLQMKGLSLLGFRGLGCLLFVELQSMLHGMPMYSCAVLRSTPQGAEPSPARTRNFSRLVC